MGLVGAAGARGHRLHTPTLWGGRTSIECIQPTNGDLLVEDGAFEGGRQQDAP